MRKLLRIISVGLVILVATSIFAGCGTKQAPKETVKENVKADPVDQNKVYTINWVSQNDGPVDENSPIVQEIQKKLNVKLNFIYLDRSKETELMNMRIAAGEIPDVFNLKDDRFRSLVTQDIFSEIPESKLKTIAPTLYNKSIENGGKNIWEFAKEAGKIYAVPTVNINGAYHFSPIWRDDWLKNVGITKVPETLKEAEEAFYKFVNNDPDKNGKKDTYALSDKGMSVVFGAFGGIPYQSVGGSNSYTWSLNKEGKVVLTAAMMEMKESLTLLNKWYKDGLIDPEFINGENKGQSWSNSLPLWNGKIGFSCPGLFYHINPPLVDKDLGSGFYQNFKKLQGADATYVAAKPFTGTTDKAGTEMWGTNPTGYVVMGRNVSKEPGKLEKILSIHEKLFTDREFAILTWFGRKDIEHSYSAEAGYTFIGDAAVSGVTKAKLGLANNGIGYTLSNEFDFTTKTQPARYAYAAKVGKLVNNYSTAVSVGLPSDAQYKSTIDKKIREAYMLFITGDKKLDDWDKFLVDLNNSGLEQLTKEANEAYIKFNKK